MGVIVKKIELGNTGKMVSQMCLGTMYFGSKIDKETSFSLLDQYVAAGGNYLDTANNYAHWIEGCNGDESELIIGEWMNERDNREDIFLATKCGARPFVPGEVDNVEGLSRTAILKAVDESLNRLQTDHIDLYYMHVDLRQEPLEETMETLHELVASGKVDHIGCSNMKTWRISQANEFAKIHGFTPFSSVQNWYSYLQPRPGADMWVHEFVNDDLLDYLNSDNSMTLHSYSSNLSGAYSMNSIYERHIPVLGDRFFSEDNERRFETIKSMATRKSVSVYQVLLAWMLNQDVDIIPILGVSKVSQLEDNLGALKITLSDAEMSALKHAGFTGKELVFNS